MKNLAFRQKLIRDLFLAGHTMAEVHAAHYPRETTDFIANQHAWARRKLQEQADMDEARRHFDEGARELKNERISESLKKRWADPAFQAKMRKARETPKPKRSSTWTPEKRALQSQRIKEGLRRSEREREDAYMELAVKREQQAIQRRIQRNLSELL